MSRSHNLHFPPKIFRSEFPIVILSGVNRSGKTTLGNILATAKNVEHADEPWLLYILPILAKTGLIKENTAKELFLAYLSELMNDMILLRRANFRPGDLSSIWNQKQYGDILFRLNEINSRKDVRSFLKTEKPILLLNLAESAMFALSTLSSWLPNAKIIHVVRRSHDVAQNIKEKKWFSDEQLKEPLNAQIYRPAQNAGKTFHLPWWIKSQQDKMFLKYTEFERAIFYWCSMIEYAQKTLAKLKNNNKCLTIKFEDFQLSPDRTLAKTLKFIGARSTPLTLEVLEEFKKINWSQQNKPGPDLTHDLANYVGRINKFLGYNKNE